MRTVIEVEWLDAQSDMETMSVEELSKLIKPILTKSVGYLVVDDDDYAVLGFTDFGDNNIGGHIVIPKVLIKKQSVLREGGVDGLEKV
jgi:hypothetical protein